jgi:hypothetical protein
MASWAILVHGNIPSGEPGMAAMLFKSAKSAVLAQTGPPMVS